MEEAARGAGVREVVTIVGAGLVKLAEAEDAGDGAHEIEVGVEVVGLREADERSEQARVRIEDAAEDGAVEVGRGQAVASAVVFGKGGHHRALWCAAAVAGARMG